MGEALAAGIFIAILVVAITAAQLAIIAAVAAVILGGFLLLVLVGVYFRITDPKGSLELKAKQAYTAEHFRRNP